MVIQQLNSTHRCVSYDYRGWGDSDAPGQGYSVLDLAGDAEALIVIAVLKEYKYIDNDATRRDLYFLRKSYAGVCIATAGVHVVMLEWPGHRLHNQF